VEEKIKLKP